MTARIQRNPLMGLAIPAALMIPLAFPVAAFAQDTALAAQLTGPDGAEHGSVTAESGASGQMIITLSIVGLPPGEHGVHVHETGDCSAADFSSAGGHLAGDKAHGVMAEDGPHPGDLPNVMVSDGGSADVVYFNSQLTADMMLDDDGSAFIVHSGADDYQSQPSGDAGERIACGVFSGG